VTLISNVYRPIGLFYFITLYIVYVLLQFSKLFIANPGKVSTLQMYVETESEKEREQKIITHKIIS
jgi:hypothetical protein